jgi:hypothetical protein
MVEGLLREYEVPPEETGGYVVWLNPEEWPPNELSAQLGISVFGKYRITLRHTRRWNEAVGAARHQILRGRESLQTLGAME